MIDLLKKLFRIKTDPKGGIAKSRHYKNLMTGPKVYLDGKPYVRVKFRFVDTLDFDTTKHLDQLETEIEFQNIETERLLRLNSNYEDKIKDLQTLNINLVSEIRSNTSKHDKEISKLSVAKAKRNSYIVELEKNCRDLNKSIEEFKNQIKQLKIDLGSKDNRIGSLEQQVHFLVNTKQNPISGKKGFVRLRTALHTAEHDLISKFNEIEKKDKFIAIMTQKIFEKETKIHELETMLNPPKKK
jgi:chromosome segregation ATPase